VVSGCISGWVFPHLQLSSFAARAKKTPTRANVRGEDESFFACKKSFGGVYLPWTGDSGCVLVSPGERHLTGKDTRTDVADTTATPMSDSETSLPVSGLRLYRWPVKAARPWPLQAVVAVAVAVAVSHLTLFGNPQEFREA
jgi:hypothetical protein